MFYEIGQVILLKEEVIPAILVKYETENKVEVYQPLKFDKKLPSKQLEFDVCEHELDNIGNLFEKTKELPTGQRIYKGPMAKGNTFSFFNDKEVAENERKFEKELKKVLRRKQFKQ